MKNIEIILKCGRPENFEKVHEVVYGDQFVILTLDESGNTVYRVNKDSIQSIVSYPYVNKDS